MRSLASILVFAIAGGGVLTLLPMMLSGQGRKIVDALAGRGGRG